MRDEGRGMRPNLKSTVYMLTRWNEPHHKSKALNIQHPTSNIHPITSDSILLLGRAYGNDIS
jgi:hypothetical protein